ncbi:uncharacterized protein LOC123551546 isoform X2 [Mercenaria mercenaria]|uniref:uncharacterized protein LOC123551546 isoform X2 n=1 Tax=Mercenaria mercenaria TaxID=6596 RepID=UPI00234E6ACC|nr:uncharacterized protein LOC123551546 isoform X2 [Mercenaria mercenaria]
MAKLTWIIFGIFVVCCSAHFGIDRNGQQFLQRQKSNPFNRTPQSFLSSLGVNPEDRKCFTLARRQFYISRLVHYPCNRQRPGVPVLRWFMGQFGPTCVSYYREPVYRYYRIPVCCPGYAMDRNGKCSIKTTRLTNNSGRNNGEMMSVASKMRQAMWHRAKQDMERRRAMFFMNMRDNRRNNRPMMPPRMQLRRPPMSPMFNMYNRQQMPTPPKVAFLRFNRPTLPRPPMPHPVQQPPLSGRMVRIIKRKIIPLFPFIRRNDRRLDRIRPPMVPRVVLSGRISALPMNGMREFHPPMPSLPRIEPPFQPFMNNEHSQENGQRNPDFGQQPRDYQPDGFHDPHDQRHDQHHDQHHPETHGFHEPFPGESRMTPEDAMQVDLPNEPVQMPDLVVEQAPTNNMNQDSCIVKLESAVKTCLKQNNIDVPDVMSAFEPFNDDKSRVLCEAEDAIFNCITETLKDCKEGNDANIARDMLLETAQTVQSMCEMRQANVASGDTPPPQEENVQGADTVATVENVDDIPTDVNAAPTPDKEQITIIEDSPAVADTPSAQAVKEAIQHEVHVQEMRMKEYLLPILVGAGVGFMVLVLFMSLLICCCCKRKLRKKMKMAKEMEKPPLQDGIYTIGIAPPTYETNGIPPMYYEEAKGEKITSRSSAVLEGSEALDEAEGVKM